MQDWYLFSGIKVWPNHRPCSPRSAPGSEPRRISSCQPTGGPNADEPRPPGKPLGRSPQWIAISVTTALIGSLGAPDIGFHATHSDGTYPQIPRTARGGEPPRPAPCRRHADSSRGPALPPRAGRRLPRAPRTRPHGARSLIPGVSPSVRPRHRRPSPAVGPPGTSGWPALPPSACASPAA